MIFNNGMFKNEKKFNKAMYLTFIFSSLVILLFVLSKKMDFMFMSNDDLYIQAILSGDLTGVPDAHAIYILYPLAWFISSLYKLSSNINWYGSFIIGMHCACWGIILYRVISLANTKCKQICNFFITYFFLIFLDLYWMVFSQYTALAGIIGCTAVFWFITIKIDDKWRAYVPVATLMLLSFMLRNKAALMCIPFLFIFALYKFVYYFFDKNDKENAKKIFKMYFLFFVALGTIFVLVFSVHKLAYQSDEWKQYNEYNKYRTQVYDFGLLPNYEENVEFYNSIGIEDEEMYLLLSMNLILDENINSNKMQAIYEKGKEIKKYNEQFYNVPRKIFFDYLDSFKYLNRELIIVYMLYGVMFILFIVQKRNSLWIAFVSIFLTRSLIISYFINVGRFPERVASPLAIVEFCLLFGIISHTFSEENENIRIKNELTIGFKVGSIIIASFMLLLLMDVYKENLDKNIEIKNGEQWVANLFPYIEKNIDNNYLLEIQTIAAMKAPIFGEYSRMPKNALTLGGWLEKSPLLETQYRNQFDSLLVNEILMKKNTYIIQRNELSIFWLEDFLNRRGKLFKVKEVNNIKLNENNLYSIIQLTREE